MFNYICNNSKGLRKIDIKIRRRTTQKMSATSFRRKFNHEVDTKRQTSLHEGNQNAMRKYRQHESTAEKRNNVQFIIVVKMQILQSI